MSGALAQAGEPTTSTWHEHGGGVPHHHSSTQISGADSEPLNLSADRSASPLEYPPYLNAKAKCNNCAPCCASAALTGDVSIPITARASGVDFPALIHVPPSAPVGNLDRPPRTILA
ncbi:MAG: hypothetical protein Q7J21_10760 [Rugosibacter sp.]|nr:hypothetical protein [Rugosibacter sp.]